MPGRWLESEFMDALGGTVVKHVFVYKTIEGAIARDAALVMVDKTSHGKYDVMLLSADAHEATTLGPLRWSAVCKTITDYARGCGCAL